MTDPVWASAVGKMGLRKVPGGNSNSRREENSWGAGAHQRTWLLILLPAMIPSPPLTHSWASQLEEGNCLHHSSHSDETPSFPVFSMQSALIFYCSFLMLWIVVLEKTLESPLDCKEIKPVNPKGNQSWIFIGKTDVEAEDSILWPPDGKNWPLGKDPDAGKDWWQEEKGTTEGEMVGWHNWLDGHGFG